MHERSTREVFEDHLRHRSGKDLEADLHNYDEDCVILTGYGVFHGHDGVRQSSEILGRDVPNGSYTYTTKLDADEMAFLEWTAEADGVRVLDGVDSFLIRDGKIIVQTIHYRVE